MPGTARGGFRSSQGTHTLVHAPESQPYLVVDVWWICAGVARSPTTDSQSDVCSLHSARQAWHCQI